MLNHKSVKGTCVSIHSLVAAQFFEQSLVLVTNADDHFFSLIFQDTQQAIASGTVTYPFSFNLALIPRTKVSKAPVCPDSI